MDMPTGTQKKRSERERSRVRHRAENAHRGYTLLEMLLTIGLVVAMTGLAWPALRGPLANQRLREAAKTVRIELARTRLRAMETAEPYQLRYLPGTGHFYVGPAAATAASDDQTDWDFSRAAIDAADDGSSTLAAGYQLELPEGVTFVTEEILDDIDTTSAGSSIEKVDGTLEESVASEAEAIPLDDPRWSAPIRFRSDGTTTSTRILLRNQQNNVVVLTLRGLTGVITVTPIVPANGGDAAEVFE